MSKLLKDTVKLCTAYQKPSTCPDYEDRERNICGYAIKRNDTSDYYCFNRKCYNGKLPDNPTITKMLSMLEPGKINFVHAILMFQNSICNFCGEYEAASGEMIKCPMDSVITSECIDFTLDKVNDKINKMLQEIAKEEQNARM